LIVYGYKEPATPPMDNYGKKLIQNNLRYKNSILNGLVDLVYVKVMHCDSTKKIWDKIQNVYEGDAKVKEAKLQNYRGQFEQLKMNEHENNASGFLQVVEIVNAIKGLGEEVGEFIIVQKVLRSLPMRFDPNISSLKEISYLSTIILDEIHGIFIVCEMRTIKENTSIKKHLLNHQEGKITRKISSQSQIVTILMIHMRMNELSTL
jgi:hypothetical protein